MRKSLFTVAAVVASLCGFSETFTWTGPATFLQEDQLPTGWKFRIGAKKIKISRTRGTVIFVR